MRRQLLVLEVRAAAGAGARLAEVLDRIRVRAEGVGCHCWAFAGERSPDEITVFIEGRFPDGALRPIFEGDIEALRSVTAGVERVRSLVEHPREEGT